MKENETRGSSVLDPVHWKGDALAQTWVDRRILATLSNWLDEVGLRPRSLSEVVRLTLEQVTEALVDRGDVDMVSDPSQATWVLESKYRAKLNPGGRGKKNLLHNIMLSERKREQALQSTGAVTRTSSDKRVRIDTADIEEAKKAIESARSALSNKYQGLDSDGLDKLLTESGKAERKINMEVVDKDPSIKKLMKSDVARQKTTEEMDEDGKRIEEKDKKLLDQMDSCNLSNAENG